MNNYNATRNKLGLTAEEIQSLEALSAQGFLFISLLKGMPPEISKRYADYYGHRGARNATQYAVNRFCGITLALIKGYSAEEREAYLKTKRKPREKDSN